MRVDQLPASGAGLVAGSVEVEVEEGAVDVGGLSAVQNDGVALVFGVEDGFVGVGERLFGAAFAVLVALLVEGPVEGRFELGGLVVVVFETDGQAETGGRCWRSRCCR